MSNPYFSFKRFTVWQDQCAMKVGTDAAVLGAYTSVDRSRYILDIGTGTGVVALMLAQRADGQARIVALDIDQAAASQAASNVAASPWKDRVEVLCADFLLFDTPSKFDTIVCNPPYFVNSLTCPDYRRGIARHNGTLTYQNLFERVARIITQEGIFTLIVPAEFGQAIAPAIAMEVGLHVIARLSVKTLPDKPVKRFVYTLSPSYKHFVSRDLLIESAPGKYTDDFINLMRPYYLGL